MFLHQLSIFKTFLSIYKRFRPHSYATKLHQPLSPHCSRSIRNAKPSDWRQLYDRIQTDQYNVEIWTTKGADIVNLQLSSLPYQLRYVQSHHQNRYFYKLRMFARSCGNVPIEPGPLCNDTVDLQTTPGIPAPQRNSLYEKNGI